MSWSWPRFGRERRAETIGTSDPALAEFLGNRAGLVAGVDANRASGLAVAYAAIRTIAENLSAVPLNLYRRTEDGGRVRATDHPLHDVLHSRPADGLTAFEAREFMIASLATMGNAYARLDWNGRGQVVGLRPLDPRLVAVERLTTGRLRYRLSGRTGGVTVLTQDEVLHVRHRLAPDGMLGLSPIQVARETFAVSLTEQEQAGKQARRAFRPEGVLAYPNPIRADGKAQAIDRIAERADAANAAGGVLVLDGGATWTSMALSPKDAQFIEARKLSNLDVARIFGVPPTCVGIVDNATYSNVDGESRALVARCLAPMARRIEQAMNAALLPELARRTLFIEHDLAGLLRGDLGARYDAYRTGRDAGFLSANEIRAWENLPKIDGGDEYLSPLNMTPAGKRAPIEEGAS